MKDVIKSGGEWVSSLALESIASGVSGVGEAAAIGMPDPQWGERPLLLIVGAEGFDQERCEEALGTVFDAEVAYGGLSKWAVPERHQVCVRNRQDQRRQDRQEGAAGHSDLTGPSRLRSSIDLVDPDMWVIVVMEADRRVVDLAKIE